jgi:hypothetical protein
MHFFKDAQLLFSDQNMALLGVRLGLEETEIEQFSLLRAEEMLFNLL